MTVEVMESFDKDNNLVKRTPYLRYDKNELISIFVPNVSKVLDVGCGAYPILSQDRDIVSIDDHTPVMWYEKFERQMKTGAIKGFKKIDIKNFVQADAHALPFKNFSFDFVVSSELLEHVNDPLKVLDEMQRVALNVVFSVPNEHDWSEDKRPFTNPGHKRFFDEKTLLNLLNESGLHSIEFMKVNFEGWSYFIVSGISKHVKRRTEEA